MDIVRHVLYQAKTSPQKPAIAFTGGVATYGMLGSAIHASTNHILGAGLQPGGLVAIDVRNPIHHLALIFALERCGITSISVPTSFSVTASGLKPDAIILDRYGSALSGARTLAVDDGWFTLDGSVSSPEGPGIADGQYHRVVLSSGTTGVPKAIGITGRVMERRLLHGIVWGSDGGRTLSMFGFSTVLAVSPIFTLAGGGLACFAPNPQEALHLIRVFGVTQLFAASGQLQGLIDCQTRDFEPCPSLKMVGVGGSRIPGEVLAKTRSLLCNNLVIAYGSSETGTVCYARAADVEGIEEAVGYMTPWARVEAVDEDFRVLPAGQAGLLRLWSDMVAEYVAERPEDRAILREDGWFYPGDIGTISEDGLVAITGRSIELINRGGAIVAPQFIEDVLAERSEVAQVGAFGVTNDQGFEEIWAAIVPKAPLNRDEIFRFCRHRLGDKTPDVLVTVDDIPRTDTGKIMRTRLRELAVQRHKAEANPMDAATS